VDQPVPIDVTVERSLVVDATPEQVWEALLDRELLAEWFGGEVALDPVEGGTVRVDGDAPRWGVVERVEPGESLWWWWAGEDGPASQVAIDLERDRWATRVTVREQRLSVTHRAVEVILAPAGPSGGPMGVPTGPTGPMALVR
jgi:uncharacterized protein YndB with AHSA1/START domain